MGPASVPRWAGRTVLALVVVGFHLVLAQVFNLSTLPPRGSAPSDALEVSLFLEDVERSEELVRVPDPPLKRLSLAPFPAISTVIEDEPATPPAVLAITIPGPGEPRPVRIEPPPILEADPGDVATVQALCGAAHPESVPAGQGEGAVTLWLRVEPNGRPSQIKVMRSSGSANLDAEITSCVRSFGSFAPPAGEGEAIATLLRIVWPRRPSS